MSRRNDGAPEQQQQQQQQHDNHNAEEQRFLSDTIPLLNDLRASLRQVQLTHRPGSLAELEAAFWMGDDRPADSEEPQETILWWPGRRAFISNLAQFGIAPPDLLLLLLLSEQECSTTDPKEKNDGTDNDSSRIRTTPTSETLLLDASDERQEQYWSWTVHAETVELEREIWIQILSGRSRNAAATPCVDSNTHCSPQQQREQQPPLHNASSEGFVRLSSSSSCCSPTMKIKLGSTVSGYVPLPFSDADWEGIVRTHPTLGYDSFRLSRSQGRILAQTARGIQLDDCLLEDPADFYAALDERQGGHSPKLQALGLTGHLGGAPPLMNAADDTGATTRLWNWLISCCRRGDDPSDDCHKDDDKDNVVLSSLSLERLAVPTVRSMAATTTTTTNHNNIARILPQSFPKLHEVSLCHCRVDLEVITGLVRSGLQRLHMQGLLPRTTVDPVRTRRQRQNVSQQPQPAHSATTNSNNGYRRIPSWATEQSHLNWEPLVDAMAQSTTLQHWTLWEMALGSPYVVQVIQQQTSRAGASSRSSNTALKNNCSLATTTPLPASTASSLLTLSLHTLDLDDIFDFTPPEWQALLAAAARHPSLRLIRVRSVLDGVRYQDIPGSFLENYLDPARQLLQTNHRVDVVIPPARYETRFADRPCPLAPLRRRNEWYRQVEKLGAVRSSTVCPTTTYDDQDSDSIGPETTREEVRQKRRYQSLVSRSFQDKNKTRLGMLLRQHLDVLIASLQKRFQINDKESIRSSKRRRRV